MGIASAIVDLLFSSYEHWEERKEKQREKAKAAKAKEAQAKIDAINREIEAQKKRLEDINRGIAERGEKLRRDAAEERAKDARPIDENPFTKKERLTNIQKGCLDFIMYESCIMKNVDKIWRKITIKSLIDRGFIHKAGDCYVASDKAVEFMGWSL